MPTVRPPVKVLIATFPFLNQQHPDVADWMTRTVLTCKSDVRVTEVFRFRLNDTPAPMVRNNAISRAKEVGADLLIMIDNDMKPDAYLPGTPQRLGDCPHAKPFFDSSFEFWWHHDGPCVIAAPYVGPPPISNVYVFRWANQLNDNPDGLDFKLAQFSREEAATKRGIERVAALPTGLIMIDMRCFDHILPPYTYYEWRDEFEREKVSTEDVTLTRDLGLSGVPQYCNWDAWCGHWKQWCMGRPVILTADMMADKYRRAVEAGMVPKVTPEPTPIAPHCDSVASVYRDEEDEGTEVVLCQ